MESSNGSWLEKLRSGVVIPAHPLALTADRKLDERRQRALTRYYVASGAGGIAVGVHTTQFGIRRPEIGLLRPVLELAAETARGSGVIQIAGICGRTLQAVTEAQLARDLGYDAGLLSLAALPDASIAELLNHARAVAAVIPVVGFYLQPSVGGRLLPYDFWREFAEIENVVAIKMAPFNRYQTIDVVRAVCESGRAAEITLYTGNDDNILPDLLTRWVFGRAKRAHFRRAAGALGGVDTAGSGTTGIGPHVDCRRCADSRPTAIAGAEHHGRECRALRCGQPFPWVYCAGLHEILRRQGLLEGRWCLDPDQDLSPGQMEEIDRVWSAYPHLNDDAFVKENCDAWLA